MAGPVFLFRAVYPELSRKVCSCRMLDHARQASSAAGGSTGTPYFVSHNNATFTAASAVQLNAKKLYIALFPFALPTTRQAADTSIKVKHKTAASEALHCDTTAQ